MDRGRKGGKRRGRDKDGQRRRGIEWCACCCLMVSCGLSTFSWFSDGWRGVLAGLSSLTVRERVLPHPQPTIVVHVHWI